MFFYIAQQQYVVAVKHLMPPQLFGGSAEIEHIALRQAEQRTDFFVPVQRILRVFVNVSEKPPRRSSEEADVIDYLRGIVAGVIDLRNQISVDQRSFEILTQNLVSRRKNLIAVDPEYPGGLDLIQDEIAGVAESPPVRFGYGLRQIQNFNLRVTDGSFSGIVGGGRIKSDIDGVAKRQNAFEALLDGRSGIFND
jgi:hypothetical protein